MVNMNKLKRPAIYALHTGDHRYFYVGATCQNSQTRLWEHIHRARSGHTGPVYAWMREVGIANVEVVDLEPITEPENRAVQEAACIARMIEAGHPLVNRIARDGVPNSMSAESKALLSARRAGKPTWIKGRRGDDAGWTDARRQAQSDRMKARRANKPY